MENPTELAFMGSDENGNIVRIWEVIARDADSVGPDGTTEHGTLVRHRTTGDYALIVWPASFVPQWDVFPWEWDVFPWDTDEP